MSTCYSTYDDGWKKHFTWSFHWTVIVLYYLDTPISLSQGGTSTADIQSAPIQPTSAQSILNPIPTTIVQSGKADRESFQISPPTNVNSKTKPDDLRAGKDIDTLEILKIAMYFVYYCLHTGLEKFFRKKLLQFAQKRLA